jgi:hypothetical protein
MSQHTVPTTRPVSASCMNTPMPANFRPGEIIGGHVVEVEPENFDGDESGPGPTDPRGTTSGSRSGEK